MNKHIKIITLRIVGILLILIGLISGLVPLLQGWIFVLIGAILLIASFKQERREKVWTWAERQEYGIGNISKRVRRGYERLSQKYSWLE